MFLSTFLSFSPLSTVSSFFEAVFLLFLSEHCFSTAFSVRYPVQRHRAGNTGLLLFLWRFQPFSTVPFKWRRQCPALTKRRQRTVSSYVSLDVLVERFGRKLEFPRFFIRQLSRKIRNSRVKNYLGPSKKWLTGLQIHLVGSLRTPYRKINSRLNVQNPCRYVVLMGVRLVGRVFE